MLRIAGAAASAQCFDDVIELVAEETLVALRAASVSISRWERDRGVLRTLINVGEMEAAEERFPSDEVHPLAGYGHVEDLVLRGRPYRTAITGRGDEGVAIDPRPGEGAQPELGVPIRCESAMWGELGVRGGAWRRFDERDVSFAAGDRRAGRLGDRPDRAVRARLALGLRGSAHRPGQPPQARGVSR